MKILAIFDNGGATLDRYTFVTDERDRHSGYYDMLGTDENGSGFSQWGQGRFDYHGDNKHLGKQVKWDSLTDALRAHVSHRLTEQ